MGAALLKDPKKLSKLLNIVVSNSKIPVTIKIRTGWDINSVNAKDIALIAEDAGVKALFIHGRTRVQDYAGDVDYKTIKMVKDAVGIPVFGSGNVFSAPLAKKMLDETGCDGVVVARGALGNPWIFKEIDHYLKNNVILPKPPRAEVIKIMLEHLGLAIKFYGERNGVLVFRKFFTWYTAGFSNVRHLREKVCYAKKERELIKLIEKLKDEEYNITKPSHN